MKQGTGKTRVAIDLANSTDATLVVFIVPHALKHNTKSEINKWGLKKPYLIETYQGVAMSDNRYVGLIERIKGEKVMIVADESIFIKNELSKTSKRMDMLRRLSEYRLILNGTPLTKNEWDLYNQMIFLSPEIMGMSRGEFLKTFFTRISYKKKGQAAKEFYKFSEVNAEYLKEMIKPYTFEVDLEFSKLETTRRIELIDCVEREYQYLKAELINGLKKANRDLLPLLRRMSQLMFTDEDRLEDMVKHIKGQCIVFCSYRKEMDYLRKRLNCYAINGDTQDRECIMERFKNDDKPLLIMFGIGAFGHNMQYCNRVMFSSLTFDYGKIDQAKHRIKRIGQERDIEYTIFTSRLGLFKMIEDNLEKKQELHQLVQQELEGDNFECL